MFSVTFTSSEVVDDVSDLRREYATRHARYTHYTIDQACNSCINTLQTVPLWLADFGDEAPKGTIAVARTLISSKCITRQSNISCI